MRKNDAYPRIGSVQLDVFSSKASRLHRMLIQYMDVTTEALLLAVQAIA
jgi:hypothetical protein